VQKTVALWCVLVYTVGVVNGKQHRRYDMKISKSERDDAIESLNFIIEQLQFFAHDLETSKVKDLDVDDIAEQCRQLGFDLANIFEEQ